MAAALPSGAAIAKDALKYQGQGYTYGGSAARPGDWDCSSFVSYVLGHDFGLTLPGGGTFGSTGYPPSVHGPVVVTWNTWNAATTIPGPPQAGDLCVWPGLGTFGHIGIATGPTTMISALDTQQGTVQTPIAGYGPSGVQVVYRRLNGEATAAAVSGAQSVTGLLGEVLVGAALGGGFSLLIIGGILAGAALLAAAGAGLIAYAASRG